MKRFLSGFLITLAIPSVMFAQRAIDTQSHSWNGYHWARTANPFTLKLGDNLTSSDWKGHLSQTSGDWNALNTPVRTTIVPGTSSKRCSMVAGTTQVCNGTYGNNGWLGLASINVSGSHITQGTAKMNDTYFNTATYNNKNEREHVMCQEVAHTFGLGHQDESGASLNTCMDYFSNTGANAGSTVSTKPNAHDKDELNTIYSHLDSTTTVANIWDVAAASVAKMPGDLLANAGQWGTAIDHDAYGRPNLFAMELGTDHAGERQVLITHVYWVEPMDDDVTVPSHNRTNE